MVNFERVGTSPFRPNGTTMDTDIQFGGGSQLKVYGGCPFDNFRIRFSNSENEGWWIGLTSLNHLIAELLYIRRDMQGFEDGRDLDIEVGAVPMPPDPRTTFHYGDDAMEEAEEEEDEENTAPF